MYAAKIRGRREAIDPAEYAPAFAGMRCLTRLDLSHVADSVVLLPALALAPALTELQISFTSLDPAITPPPFETLLGAAPRLTVTLTASDHSVYNARCLALRPLLTSEPTRLLLREGGVTW